MSAKMRSLHPPHMPRDARQLPYGDFETSQDFARAGMTQGFDVAVLRNAAEAEAVGDAVHVAQEPRKTVGQRAVEVEDGEEVGHRFRCFMVSGWRRTSAS